MDRANRRATTGGSVIRDNRVWDALVMVDGSAARHTTPWYYRRHTFDGRVFTGPAGEVYAGYPRGTRPIPARPF